MYSFILKDVGCPVCKPSQQSRIWHLTMLHPSMAPHGLLPVPSINSSASGHEFMFPRAAFCLCRCRQTFNDTKEMHNSHMTLKMECLLASWERLDFSFPTADAPGSVFREKWVFWRWGSHRDWNWKCSFLEYLVISTSWGHIWSRHWTITWPLVIPGCEIWLTTPTRARPLTPWGLSSRGESCGFLCHVQSWTQLLFVKKKRRIEDLWSCLFDTAHCARLLGLPLPLKEISRYFC